MSETQEPWDIEDARREREAREEREIFGPVMYSMSDAEFLKLREAARRDCDVCLYDRHCASHCAEDCEHRATLFDWHTSTCVCIDCCPDFY